MENVLRDLYRQQTIISLPDQDKVSPTRAKSSQQNSGSIPLQLLRDRLERNISSINNIEDARRQNQLRNGFNPAKRKPIFDSEQVKKLGSTAAHIPGFEDLEDKQKPAEIVCWAMIIFVLIALTGYSFVLLIMDYLENPTRTSVSMYYSPYKTMTDATLCVPLYIDKIPLAEKQIYDEYYTWKAAAKTLKAILDEMETKNLSYISDSDCLQNSPQKNLTKRSLKVRLIDESGKENNRYGRVELNLDGIWGGICDEGWNKQNSQVTCRMLTGSISSDAKTLHTIITPVYPELAWMDHVKCEGNEQNIGYCSHSGWGETDCTYLNYAAVDCFGNANPSAWLEPEEASSETSDSERLKRKKFIVRLRDERGIVNKKWGSVEVGNKRNWGIVSDEHWTDAEAKIVCHMLGWPKGIGEAYRGSILLNTLTSPAWGKTFKCNGNETNLMDCANEITSLKNIQSAGADCTGQAETRNRLSRIVRDFILSKTVAALLARLTTFETSNLVGGETKSSFKWSTSPTYPAGNLHKEQAIEILIQILKKSGQGTHLRMLKQMLTCWFCHAMKLGVYIQRDEFTSTKDMIFDCSEMPMTWIEDAADSNKICFKLPFGKNKIQITRGILEIKVDQGSLYKSVAWTNDSAREIYSKNFNIDFGGSQNNKKETATIVELAPGEQQTVIVDITAAYNTEETKECVADANDCEIRCISRMHGSACAHRCVPFTWEKLKLPIIKHGPVLPYCMLKDYQACYQNLDDVKGALSNCSKKCGQPCNYASFAIRTLFKKPLKRKSQAKVLLKLNHEVYPKFKEESAVSWYGLMGDLGGVIGLWLGASFMGVLHLAWFFITDVLTALKIKKFQRQLSSANLDGM